MAENNVMYGRRKTDYSDKEKRQMIVKISISVVALALVLVSYSFLTQKIKHNQDQYVEDSANNVFDSIEEYIAELSYNSNQNSYTISNAIRENIEKEYTDLKVLEKEMSEGKCENLTKVISNTIKSNHEYLNGIHNNRNSIIVTTNKDIIYNPDYDTTINKGPNETWQDFINTNFNKDLAKNAYQSLTSLQNSYVFIEPYASDLKNHVYYKTVDIDTLRKVYNSEGIGGLKHYQLLTANYIENTQDLFGNQEIIKGVKQSTYRIIVIQRCNIYDQLKENKSYLIKYNTDKLIHNNNYIMLELYGIGIILCFGFMLLLAVASNIFNRLIIGKLEGPMLGRRKEDKK